MRGHARLPSATRLGAHRIAIRYDRTIASQHPMREGPGAEPPHTGDWGGGPVARHEAPELHGREVDARPREAATCRQAGRRGAWRCYRALCFHFSSGEGAGRGDARWRWIRGSGGGGRSGHVCRVVGDGSGSGKRKPHRDGDGVYGLWADFGPLWRCAQGGCWRLQELPSASTVRMTSSCRSHLAPTSTWRGRRRSCSWTHRCGDPTKRVLPRRSPGRI